MNESTASTIERVGLIPVLRAHNATQAHAVVQAMIAGGVTVVEVTMTVPGAIDVLKDRVLAPRAVVAIDRGLIRAIQMTIVLVLCQACR